MNYVIDSTSLSSIADAIRSKTGKSSSMQVSEMVSEIESIVTEPAQIEKSITENGVYNASDDDTYGYSKVTVDVPLPENGYLLKDLSGLPASSATVSDAQALPLSELKAEIAPTQSGTPWWASSNDLAPYLFRATPQLGNPYNHENDKIVGASVAWNQLASAVRDDAVVNGMTFTKSSTTESTITGTCDTTNWYRVNHNQAQISVVQNHIYMIGWNTIFPSEIQKVRIGNDNTTAIFNNAKSAIAKCNQNSTGNIAFYIPENTVMNNTFRLNVTDLTLLFANNPAIADYIYSLEQSEAGAGIAWLKSYGFFTKDYYAYDAGSIQSVKTSGHKTIGFNQWDEQWELGYYGTSTGNKGNANNQIRSKNFIDAVPNTSYYRTLGASSTYICQYDENHNFINTKTSNPFVSDERCRYFTITFATSYGTTYNNDICINLSDPNRDGQYEPYVEHTYPLDGAKEWRGLFRLDSNNNLYADGDIYPPSGEASRYAILQSFDGTEDWKEQPPGSGGDKYFYLQVGEYQSIRSGLILCNKITYASILTTNTAVGITTSNSQGLNIAQIRIRPNNVADISLANFKTWLSANPITCIYLATTPTTESADPYQSPQIVDNWGTEEYIDSRDVPIPVGHETRYYNEAPIVGFTQAIITRTAGADSKTYMVDLDGTVYGGVLDVVKGELTITYGYVDLGDLEYLYSTTHRTNGYFYAAISGIKRNSDLTCSKYVYGGIITGTAGLANAVDKNIYKYDTTQIQYRIYIIDESYTDATALKASLSGSYLAYELETATVVTLTPTAVATLLGSNTFTASTGDIMSLKYFSKE